MSTNRSGGLKGSRPSVDAKPEGEAAVTSNAPVKEPDDGVAGEGEAIEPDAPEEAELIAAYAPRTERVKPLEVIEVAEADYEQEMIDSVSKGMFSPEELEELRLSAKAKVAADKKAAAKLALMEHFEDAARVEEGMAPKQGPAPDRRRVGVTIGIPKFAEDIRFDNRVFVAGHTYEVTPAQFVSLVDQMQWSWRHEDEVHGELNETGRRERDTHIRHGKMMNAPMRLNTSTNMHRH